MKNKDIIINNKKVTLNRKDEYSMLLLEPRIDFNSR